MPIAPPGKNRRRAYYCPRFDTSKVLYAFRKAPSGACPVFIPVYAVCVAADFLRVIAMNTLPIPHGTNDPTVVPTNTCMTR
jgi:hypothetical protein